MTDAAAAKKVLIVVPTAGIDPDPNRWLRFYLSVIADVRSKGFTYAPFFIYRKTWFAAMNQMFDAALENDFDYILRMDDDVWGGGLNYFSKLYEADKDVIGVNYAMRGFPYALTCLRKVDPSISMLDAWTNQYKNFVEVEGDGVQPVDLIGMGMTLIKVSPFRLIPRPLFPEKELCPDDTYLAHICEQNGIKQFAHMDLKLAHRDVTPFNRKYLLNADARLLLQTGSVKADGNEFHEKMVAEFGADGMKDIGQLKAL